MERQARMPLAEADELQRGAAYDVVALIASAGSHEPMRALLQRLGRDFPVPIVVMQHLGPDAVLLPRPFGRSIPFRVEWARTGTKLTPGCVLMAPPRSFLQLMPDQTCLLSNCERGALDKPMDRMFESLARSFAHRAIGVVLSGLLDDGARGALELHAAGGAVIAQSDAEFGSMPQAVIRCGAADLTLPVEEIADLLGKLARGAALPRQVTELDAVEQLFAGEGLAREAMRAVSWEATPLGPVREWPPLLSTLVRNVMCATFPSCIFWGPELVQIYNEAYLPLLGAKMAPAGKPARLTWAELWSSLGSQLETVLVTGVAVSAEDQLFQPERHGYAEEAYLTYSYSPLHDIDGKVLGVLSTSTETTERVRASRRLRVLRDLAAIKSGESPLLVAESAAKVLGHAPLDVPFALLYFFDEKRRRAHLAASVGVVAGSSAAPHDLALSDDRAVWPLAEVLQTSAAVMVQDLSARLSGFHAGPWLESPAAAMLLPLSRGAEGPLAGVLVLGRSPRLRFDSSYEDFLRLVARHISGGIGEAEARRQQRERADRLAELDRAKVEFFSNVSHEFRTPLTLLLGPLEEMLQRRQTLPADLEAPIDAATRNGKRLLTLVNTLLDFSLSESQRQQAHFEPTDLALLTTDIASAFRSAIETPGLRFDVRCAENLPLVAVDPQMWEKIVSNLLSNALKFTFEGGITLELRALSLHAELVIKDTGIGIPEDQLANIFKRFHRVRGARARTAEGSGIGLWLVDDLIKRMGGMLRVASKENVGTTFTIWMAYQTKRHALESPKGSSGFQPTEFARQAAQEASRWIVDAHLDSGVLHDPFGPPQALPIDAREPADRYILVVDDNADMRDYLARLLIPRWRVQTAADGTRAFAAALERRPEVILADVMMPGLDGFDLLKQVRAHPDLQRVPVVLLTARAGEEAAIEGLLAGADDYIAKPFSPREIVARIAAAAERARAEAERARAEAARQSEAALLARNEELLRFNNVAMGRELRMIELKRQVNALRERLGEPPLYQVALEETKEQDG